MTINIPFNADLREAARQFLRVLPPGRRIIDFSGPMGAGKTTFISALCRELGVIDEPASPTFSIVNEYTLPSAADGEGPASVFHFDFYRLDSPAQALEIGVEDYFYSGAFCLMEWAENIEDILPDETLRVEISVNPDNSRTLRFDE